MGETMTIYYFFGILICIKWHFVQIKGQHRIMLRIDSGDYELFINQPVLTSKHTRLDQGDLFQGEILHGTGSTICKRRWHF